MAIPEAVQRQAEAIAAYDARLLGTTETPEPPADPQPQDPPPPEPTTTTEAATPTPEPRKAVKRQADKDDEDTWKQRYYGLQGVFNVTVPPLQARVKELEAKLEEMQRQPQTTTEQTAPNGKRVTQQDVDAFGQDLIDMVDRKAQDVVDRVSTAYEARIKQLEEALARANGTLESVAQTQVASEQERFFKALGDAVPNWEEVQETAECQQWLASRIPGMKATWDQALKKAAESLDGAAAVEVFQAFFNTHPQFNTATKVQTQQTREIQRQVAPDKTNAAPVRSQSGKRVYSTAEFQAESDKIIRLAKQGNHVEAARIETELNAAMAEGRIRP